ncbi:APC family permease [Gordonia sp. TBRC 11910]|uniref:APC family permease n=1 Tax=Gordonia asplenii TaxID=2725283 RepID=A0A848KPL4_9ACTN|nr:APC family permease [Gordonia asplenii]NMN99958.1 APC family permease [Gordonia asplenii]
MSTTQSSPDELKSGTGLTTADIVFFVLAGVAPMGVVVAILAVSIARGTGAGVPGAYVVAGAILALFSAGYIKMSRRITNVGGFYTFAQEGLGRRAGGATAMVAVVAYNAATVGIFGGLVYYGSDVASQLFGVSVPWPAVAVVCLIAVAVLSYFEVTASAKVLAVALAAEVLILLAFNVAVLVRLGFHGFSMHVFAPAAVFGGGFGISLMLAFGSFVGFEATSLYGEEARDPRRSVPRATYLSLAVITVFYVLISWAAISAYGVGKAQQAAQADTENFIFNASTQYLGKAVTDMMAILVVTSLFAAFLAFHCNTARYHVALARDGLLPRFLARINSRHHSPVAASAAQLVVVIVFTVGFGVAGQHPYLSMGISFYGLGVLGIVVLQAIAATSIVAYFLRNRLTESVVTSIVAPALAVVGFAVALVLMVANYPTLTGSTVTWINSLPWALPVAAVLGAVLAGRRRGEPAESATDPRSRRDSPRAPETCPTPSR